MSLTRVRVRADEGEKERERAARGRGPTTPQLQVPSKQSCVPSAEFSVRERLNACPNDTALLRAVCVNALFFYTLRYEIRWVGESRSIG